MGHFQRFSLRLIAISCTQFCTYENKSLLTSVKFKYMINKDIYRLNIFVTYFHCSRTRKKTLKRLYWRRRISGREYLFAAKAFIFLLPENKISSGKKIFLLIAHNILGIFDAKKFTEFNFTFGLKFWTSINLVSQGPVTVGASIVLHRKSLSHWRENKTIIWNMTLLLSLESEFHDL